MGPSRDELKKHVFAFLTSARLDEFPDTSKKDVSQRFDACSAFRTALQLHARPYARCAARLRSG